MKTKIIPLAVALLFFSNTKAAAPNWTVTPASFQYNMTLLSVVNINCTELTNPANMIGVFMGSECRGVASTNQVVGGKYLASLFVYSNTVSGENLSFKIYNSTNDSVYSVTQAVPFQQNAAYGNASVPFVVLNNNAPSNIILSKYKFMENALVDSHVATLSTIDADSLETFTYAFVSGNGDKDNARFAISGNQLLIGATMDYESQQFSSIRVKSTDANGCSFEKSIIISTINEVEAKDPLPVSNYVSPNGDGVNDFFTISNIDSYVDFSLTVYNEYGLEVYKIDRNYANNWDATYEGKTLPTGAYYFTFNNDGKGIEYKGILNIVNSN